MVQKSANLMGAPLSAGVIGGNRSKVAWSLFALVLQNTSLVIMMRISQQQSDYITSTAVFNMEFLKLAFCVGILVRNGAVDFDILDGNFAKLSVPSSLYLLQNNLLYLALQYLDSVTYQLLYQLKILTTALFSVFMLDRKLTMRKWSALTLLMLGVIMVQLNSSSAPAAKISRGDLEMAEDSSGSSTAYIGFLAVMVSSVTSGFSGVYFERILKNSPRSASEQNQQNSIWIRNIQLGIFSCFFAVFNVAADYAKIREKGFYHGYTFLTWMVILNQAIGGLIIAMVVKYADNILKGFATSVSIIVSAFIGILFFDFSPSWMFLAGASLVMYSVHLYSKPDQPTKHDILKD